MACLVSLCSFTPFTSHEDLTKELRGRRTDGCRLLLRSSMGITRIHLLSSKSLGEGLCSMKQHHNHALANSRCSCGGIILGYKVVCTPSVISGFWVGPEIEDGWGFVEAYVNQTVDA